MGFTLIAEIKADCFNNYECENGKLTPFPLYTRSNKDNITGSYCQKCDYVKWEIVKELNPLESEKPDQKIMISKNDAGLIL